MDSSDLEFAGIKLLAAGQRYKKDAEKAELRGAHPGLIVGLRAEYEKCMRIGKELLDEAEEERLLELGDRSE
jgi:hypothetical protein